MHRFFPRPAVLVVPVALALAACADDRADEAPATDEQESAVEMEAYAPPLLTPAESTAAVAEIQANADAATRRVMGPDYEPPPEPYVDTPEKQYASCMAQAQSADEPVRSTILGACERIRSRQ